VDRATADWASGTVLTASRSGLMRKAASTAAAVADNVGGADPVREASATATVARNIGDQAEVWGPRRRRR
jgi:hypothetical protein